MNRRQFPKDTNVIKTQIGDLRELKRHHINKLNENVVCENWNAVVATIITIKQIEYAIFNLEQLL